MGLADYFGKEFNYKTIKLVGHFFAPKVLGSLN